MKDWAAIKECMTDAGCRAEAIDRAVCLYAVPYLLGRKADLDAVLPLLSAMPRTLKSLNA